METWNLHIANQLYSPLQGTLPLRLLLLQPGAPFDPIKCDLVPCQLNDVQHTYDATSYTWGSPEDPPQVECNGLTMKVQRNAFDMLTDLRLCDRPRTVWIDAICINQSDVQERSQQVRMMHQVYERAKCVVVWLGRPDEDSRLAMRYAGGLNPASHIEELGDILVMEYTISDPHFKKKQYFLDPPPETAKAKKLAAAMVSLINRPWFNRVWVQQEAAACRNTHVICGPDTVDWDNIFALGWLLSPRQAELWPSYLPYTYQASRNNLYAITEIQSHKITRSRFEAKNKDKPWRTRSLRNRLINARLYAATDPRDKIFALRNLSFRDISTWAPEADYTIPWEILYTDVALRMMKNGWLNVLSNCGKCQHPPGWILPSWAPDYRQRVGIISDRKTEITEKPGWCAGGVGSDSTGSAPLLSLAVRTGQLNKNSRRKIDPAKMSNELRSFNGPLKQLLQTYISIRCLMADEIVHIGGDLSDIPDDKWKNDDASQIYIAYINQDLEYLQPLPSKTYMNGDAMTEAYKLTLITTVDHQETAIGSDYTLQNWDPWFQRLKTEDCDPDDLSWNNYPMNKAIQNSGVLRGLRFAVTKHGYLCLVPAMSQIRDTVAIIKGYTMPVVLRPWTTSPGTAIGATPTTRPAQTEEYFELVGDAYVHGMMNNEAACINDEFRCKANPTPAQRDKMLRAAKKNNGEAWSELGFGDYTRVLDTVGLRWVNLV